MSWVLTFEWHLLPSLKVSTEQGQWCRLLLLIVTTLSNINPPTMLICRLEMVQSSALSRPGCWSLCLLNYCWINNQRRLCPVCPCPSVPVSPRITSQCPHYSHQIISSVMNKQHLDKAWEIFAKWVYKWVVSTLKLSHIWKIFLLMGGLNQTFGKQVEVFVEKHSFST